MANNNLQTSEVFKPFSDEEKAWMEKLLKHLAEYYDEEDTAKPKPYPGIDYSDLLESGLFDWEFIKYNDVTWHLWIHGDEWPNTTLIGDVLLAFLWHFERDDVWGMTWACTCSKLRPGEFSGGGLVVNRHEIHHTNAWNWVYEKVKEIEGRQDTDGTKTNTQDQ